MEESRKLLLGLALLLLLLQAPPICESLSSNAKICKSIRFTQSLPKKTNVTELQRHLQLTADGCQYVHGDVELDRIGVQSAVDRPIPGIEELSSDFLDSIEEISGRLIIKRVNMRRLTFRNLKVIRGYNTKNEEHFYSIDIVQNMYPMKLQLPQLSSVMRGDAWIGGSIHRQLYCHFAHSVNWNSLFQSNEQKLIDKVSRVTNDAGEPLAQPLDAVQRSCAVEQKCHSLCSNDTRTKPHCWSSDENGCQSNSLCSGDCYSGTCSTDDSNNEICCHSNCLGGCTGPGPDACAVCKDVSYEGTCRESCPMKENYDPGSGKIVDRSGMLQVGNICVKKCPAPFLQDLRGSFCLTECPAVQSPVNGTCIPCSSDESQPCTVCQIEKVIVLESNAHSFVNCSVLQLKYASLAVDGQVLSADAFVSLQQVRIVYGKLIVRNVTNVSFLRNLRFVSGGLDIYLSELKFLPLKKLHFAKLLLLRKVKGLCRGWFPSNFMSNEQSYRKILSDVEFDNSSSECRAAACDPQCLGECWGPGPELCVACRSVSADGVCLGSCRDANAFAENDTETGRVACRRCHSECVGGCRGPSATDCVRCRRFTEDGECVSSCSRQLQPDESGVCYSAAAATYLAIGLAAAAVACVLLLLLLLSCLYYSRRIRKYEMIDLDEMLTDPNDPNDMAQLLIVNDDDVMKQKEIGSGAFGTVYKGMLRSSTATGVKELPVAIKVLRGKNPKLGQELLNEASVLARVKHPNCIRLVALCLTEDVQLITALMPRGSLLEFVKSRRNRIGAERMLNWALQVAEGMAYLESVSIVHRDLAARNVLLQTPDSVKITDFGLARLLNISEQEYLQAGGLGEKLPVKWLSVECFESGQFSHKSDVWSYGVLLWEICTFGESPYGRFTMKTVEDILTTLQKGIRLHQPEICSIDFYNVMLSCWLPHPESRPRFEDLIGTMQECLSEPSKFIASRGAPVTQSMVTDPDSETADGQQAANMYISDPVRPVVGFQLLTRSQSRTEEEAGYMVPRTPLGRDNPAGPQ